MRFPALSLRCLVALSLCLSAAALWACGGKKPPRPVQVNVTPMNDVPPLLRGTIGAEVNFLGIEPVLVSGYGLVVGLNGTGGDVLPDNIAATMEREMGLMGIGRAGEAKGTAVEGKSPRQLLRDRNVAVVLVQAAIAPGSPAGATFDVYVRAINASSLEGGTLWTTDLRIGGPSAFGQAQARTIAKARGPIFINPFAEPGKETAGVTRNAGRILDGGAVSNPLQIEMVLLNTSFQRARTIVSAINSRFPEGPGDPGPTARGRSGPEIGSTAGGTIALRVPTRYRTQASDFLQLIRHVRVDQTGQEQFARRCVEAVKAEPYLADSVAWALEAIGQKALPFARELYEYPELAPRMAALRAGARLGDPQTAPHLRLLARTSHGAVRVKAIELLSEVDAGPSVDMALRDLLSDPDLVVRVAAYEGLAKRAERVQYARLTRMQQSNRDPGAPRLSPTHLEMLAGREFPGNTVQGIERRVIEGKFLLDLVPFGEPLVYVTQQGRPRIVLFGEDVSLARPAVVSTWSDRLMIVTDQGDDTVRIYYQDAQGNRPVTTQARGLEPLDRLITMMARRPVMGDPRPGLNMSYSEVVGAIYAVCSGGGSPAAFTTETDRLKAQLLSAVATLSVPERPETESDRDVVVLRQPEVMQEKTVPLGDGAQRPELVPITPPTKK
ncbi:MAG: flagellar basal body P-ring protein FlgI [Phycisphaeraceae bacterium]|nr:flagellar basal body P-ring protein FlgI [Phycisphaeraceae bacterium]